MNDITLDLNFADSKLDAIDRTRLQIKMLEQSNQELQEQIRAILTNPSEIIALYQRKLKTKIKQLNQQNQNIQTRIQMSKIPGYAEMTKKKTNMTLKTPIKNDGINSRDKQIERQRQRQRQRQREMKNSVNSQWQFNNSRRNPFDSIDMSDKYQQSTCQNFNMQSKTQQNPLRLLEPIQRQQLRHRTHMTIQLLDILKKTQKLQRQMQDTNKQQSSQQQHIKRSKVDPKKLQQIAKYKNKLIILLKKLKLKQTNSEKLVSSYRQIYQATLKKLQETTQLLNNVQNADMGQNIDDLYAEVIQLEEKLKYVNQQLEKLDEKQWLSDIVEELSKALKRLGIQLPQCCSLLETEEQLRERVDQLSQILIQIGLLDRCEQKDRMIMLKNYYEEQKQNNKKIVKKMQTKQQLLSKKLIDMQMNN